MKHIVDGIGYQEACNGIKCINCTFLDDERNCKIGMYIRSQKVYQERPHGEWEYLKEHITDMCNADGKLNQKETCQFILNLMSVIEKEGEVE